MEEVDIRDVLKRFRQLVDELRSSMDELKRRLGGSEEEHRQLIKGEGKLRSQLSKVSEL